MKPEESIDFLIRKNWMALARMYNERSAAFESTMAVGFVLLNIDVKGGTPSTALGPKMGMESTSLSRLLRNLEEQGLIKRVAHPTDRRSVLVTLTESGILKRDKSKAIVFELHRRVQEVMEPSELAAFYSAMLKISSVVEEMRDQSARSPH